MVGAFGIEEGLLKLRSFVRSGEVVSQNGGSQEISEDAVWRLPGDSPLSEDIEIAKIDRHLKIPSIEQFDGTTDPLDFINMFDARMSFFGHAEIARCCFYCTCLKSTALEWFNNLPPRSIELWQALKTKFRTRFSGNGKRGRREC